jgi:hypothetical protein
MEDLMQERTKILKEIENQTALFVQTTDGESQTDDDQREKMVQANNQLKDVLQTFKDKIQQMVTERPNLFDGIGEDTGERFDHLLSTIESQAIQIGSLQAERNQVEDLQNKIKELQTYVPKDPLLNFINSSVSRHYRSLETSQNELENEHRIKLEQLSSQLEQKRLTTFNHLKKVY